MLIKTIIKAIYGRLIVVILQRAEKWIYYHIYFVINLLELGCNMPYVISYEYEAAKKINYEQNTIYYNLHHYYFVFCKGRITDRFFRRRVRI